MADRSNLIPTEIVDKNGRRTVVHRKPLPVASRVDLFPRPSVPGYPEEKRHEMIREIKAAIEGEGATASRIAMVTLNQLYDGLLDRLLAVYQERPSNLWRITNLLGSGAGAGFISEALLFYPELSRCDSFTAVNMMRSLHGYRQLPVSDDYSQEPHPVPEQALALLRVMDCVDREIGGGVFRDHPAFKYVLMDDRITDVVVMNYDQVDRIIGLITDRHSVDAEMISNVLESGTAYSLQSGSL